MAISSIFDPQNIDQDALRLSRAIGLQEQGGQTNYNRAGDYIKGQPTSFGQYQWHDKNANGSSTIPKIFQDQAKSLGLDPTDFSPVNQDKVAYGTVKNLKDQNLQPAEIASQWNSGSPHNYENHSKTDPVTGKTLYDTPAYVQGVKKFYGGLVTQEQQQDQPNTQGGPTGQIEDTLSGVSKQQNLGQKLNGELGYAIGANGSETGLGGIAKGASLIGQGNVAEGVANIGLGGADIVGALGGAVGDVVGSVVGKGFSLGGQVLDSIFPGSSKAISTFTSNTVNSAISNPEVQKALTSFNSLKQSQPELARGLGDAFNIFTSLIPAVKTLGAAKSLIVGGLATQVTKTEGGAILAQQMKRDGVDGFKAIEEATSQIAPSKWKIGGQNFNVSSLNAPLDQEIKAQSSNLISELSKSGIKTPLSDLESQTMRSIQNNLTGTAQSQALREAKATFRQLSQHSEITMGSSGPTTQISLWKLVQESNKKGIDPFVKQSIDNEVSQAIKAQGLTQAEQAQKALLQASYGKRIVNEVISQRPGTKGMIKGMLQRTPIIGGVFKEPPKGLINQALLQSSRKSTAKTILNQSGIVGASNLTNKPFSQ